MENEIIQSFWTGRPLSKVERLCIKSFLDHGHKFHLYVYEEVEGLPSGATLKDASQILPKERLFDAAEPGKRPRFSPFSNLFRLELLKARGGWWVDMDVVCLKPFDFPEPTILCTSNEGKWGNIANNCIMKLEVGHPIADLCMEKLEKLFAEKQHLKATGPRSLQIVVAENNYQYLLKEPEVFNPIQWRYVKYIVNPEELFFHPRRVKRMLGITERLGRITDQSRTVHLWNEMWSVNDYDRDAAYHPKSLFEKLKAKHGIK